MCNKADFHPCRTFLVELSEKSRSYTFRGGSIPERSAFIHLSMRSLSAEHGPNFLFNSKLSSTLSASDWSCAAGGRGAVQS